MLWFYAMLWPVLNAISISSYQVETTTVCTILKIVISVVSHITQAYLDLSTVCYTTQAYLDLFTVCYTTKAS